MIWILLTLVYIACIVPAGATSHRWFPWLQTRDDIAGATLMGFMWPAFLLMAACWGICLLVARAIAAASGER